MILNIYIIQFVILITLILTIYGKIVVVVKATT